MSHPGTVIPRNAATRSDRVNGASYEIGELELFQAVSQFCATVLNEQRGASHSLPGHIGSIDPKTGKFTDYGHAMAESG
jgi:hypothetical protein